MTFAYTIIVTGYLAIAAVAIYFAERSARLEREVRARVRDVVTLSDELAKTRKRKPGPSRRAVERAAIRAKTVELRKEMRR